MYSTDLSRSTEMLHVENDNLQADMSKGITDYARLHDPYFTTTVQIKL